MKLLKEMTRDEVIEVIAAVFFRVMAFTYALSALEMLMIGVVNYYIYSYAMQPSNSHSANPYQFAGLTMGFVNFFLETAKSIIFFLLAVPLARLISRGLSHALELKPSE
jgi:hypothetical protein